MRWEQKIQHAIQTDIGLRRKNNEDAAVSHVCTDEAEWSKRGHLFVVADGMGGHAVGELASKLAVETVPHIFYKIPDGDSRVALQQAVTAANDVINKRGSQNVDFLRMGTTCTTLALTSRGAVVGHVGDSRCYRIRRDRIDQLTFDHSLVWELERQNPKAAEKLNLSQHRNVITRSLGPEPTVDVDLEGPYPIYPGDTFVLCSDGLSNQVSDEEIGAIVRELSPSQACQLLVHLANLRGGADNCTVIVVRVGELPTNVPPPIVEVEEPVGSLSWWFLWASFGLALLLVTGLSFLISGNPWEGYSVVSVAAVGMILLVWFGWKRHQEARPVSDDDLSKTNYLRPHRTAVSKSSETLFQELKSLELEVRKAAVEEHWSVDWKSHEQAVEAAGKAEQERRFARGVRDLTRAIDALMKESEKKNE
ncbi:MAG: PP2C family serine/threonine-protein phosphatase [Planctomycetaceae bacterium]